MRVYDGYIGLKNTIDQILESNIDIVLHGGDLFHKSHPTVSDISWARKQFNRLADKGIPVIGVTGNHDFANDRGKSSATAAMDDPSRGIHMVTGAYEVFEPKDGVNVHAISHLGLISEERAIPELNTESMNILISHGAAQVPGHEIFATVDSPGEAVLGYDVISAPWTVGLLGHYHGMGALPGFDKGDSGQVWYSGSLLRRGFSDPEGGRGWLLVEVDGPKKATITPQYIKQRPQFDLTPIDAAGLQAAEVEAQIVNNLEAVEIKGAIIRQRVVNCPISIRRAVDTRRLAEIAEQALVWQPEFIRPEKSDYSELKDGDSAISSLTSAGSSDLPRMYGDWFDTYSQEQGIAASIRPAVKETTTSFLREVSKDVETETSELTSDGGPF
jgi:DNA repair exonuclease SbcCD nuclease subunit